MKHSESIKELAGALAKAQGALEGAIKDSENPHFRSRYADLASVVAALKAAFPVNGLSYVQTVVTSDAAVGVETMLMHASGEWICGDPFFVPVNKADAQGFGSALTYCRRYSLATMGGVAPEDDDGNAAASAAPTQARKPATKQSAVDLEKTASAALVGMAELVAPDGMGKIQAYMDRLDPTVQAHLRTNHKVALKTLATACKMSATPAGREPGSDDL
jgi:hypothetical protein